MPVLWLQDTSQVVYLSLDHVQVSFYGYLELNSLFAKSGRDLSCTT